MLQSYTSIVKLILHRLILYVNSLCWNNPFSSNIHDTRDLVKYHFEIVKCNMRCHPRHGTLRNLLYAQCRLHKFINKNDSVKTDNFFGGPCNILTFLNQLNFLPWFYVGFFGTYPPRRHVTVLSICSISISILSNYEIVLDLIVAKKFFHTFP